MLDAHRIDALAEESRIALRRSFGKNIEDISLRNSIAFYSIAPQKMTIREEQNLFFSVTMYCHYREHAGEGKPFAAAVSEYYNHCSDSAKRDLESIIDSSYAVNGTFFQRLYSLVRKMESEAVYVDAEDMYRELQFWDSKARERKRRIAQSIVGAEEDKQ